MASIFRRKRKVRLTDGRKVVRQSQKYYTRLTDADGIKRIIPLRMSCGQNIGRIEVRYPTSIPRHLFSSSIEALTIATKIACGVFPESVIQVTKEVRFWRNLRFSWRLSQPLGQTD